MDWTNELRDSLLRAGDHIAAHYPIHREPTPEGERITFKLGIALPKEAKAPVTQYIRLFAEENGVKVKRVSHKKFLIQFTVIES
jgi:hypothetical protein